jgi:hypothetical protein
MTEDGCIAKMGRPLNTRTGSRFIRCTGHGFRLRRSIDHGLAHSRFGIVLISKHVLQKEWPQKELDGPEKQEASQLKD